MRTGPVGRRDDTATKARNVETVLGGLDIDPLFGWREQIEQQCRKLAAIEELGHLSISATEAAAAAAMREDDEPACVCGNVQIAIEQLGAVRDTNRINDRSSLHVQTPVGYVSGKSKLSRDPRSSGVRADVVSM